MTLALVLSLWFVASNAAEPPQVLVTANGAASLKNGGGPWKPDPDDVVLPPLLAALAARSPAHPGQIEPMAIQVDPAAPYGALRVVVGTAMDAGYSTFVVSPLDTPVWSGVTVLQPTVPPQPASSGPTLHLTRSGFDLFRCYESPWTAPNINDEVDSYALGILLVSDTLGYRSGPNQVPAGNSLLVVDDPVPFSNAWMSLLALTRAGYGPVVLGGGPARLTVSPTAPPRAPLPDFPAYAPPCQGATGSGEGAAGSGAARVSATIGEPMVLGGLDRALIDTIVKQRLGQFRYCYQREFADHPDLAGEMSVDFTIGRDGNVASASVKTSTLANPNVEQCVVKRFFQMEFPEPAGGGSVRVSYPFVFSPVEVDGASVPE